MKLNIKHLVGLPTYVVGAAAAESRQTSNFFQENGGFAGQVPAFSVFFSK